MTKLEALPRNAIFPAIQRPTSFWELAEAYYQAAERLCEATKSSWDIPRPDHLVFPIVFLVHQALELELKHALYLCYNIIAIKEGTKHSPMPHVHQLSTLVSKVEEIWPKLGMGFEFLDPQAKELIKDLDIFTKYGKAMRYPVDKGGKPFLGSKLAINVRELLKAVAKVRGDKLIGAITLLDQKLDCLVDTDT